MSKCTDPQPVRAALLPLYLELYDRIMPERRDAYGSFLDRIVAAHAQVGVELTVLPICRVAAEFNDAIAQAEQLGACAIVTVHLAYSPSLESIDALCNTPLPIVMLDTTMDVAFGPDTPADRIMYNHGIHGVMDLASMLRRRGRPFQIIAGHLDDPAVVRRSADGVRAARAAAEMQGNIALRVGQAFQGMGDFTVAESLLAEQFGLTVRQLDLADLDRAIQAVTDDDVAAEIDRDRERYDCDLDQAVHRRANRVGLGLRRLLAEHSANALSVNFEAFDRADRPAETMPFLELSKAMARGVGYAGEGDVLTANLVGALMRSFPAASFTEIFCPDWAGGSLFLSHMGEINPAIAATRARIFEKPLPFLGSNAPAILTCAVQPGPATFVNLAPGPDDSFSLIVAPVEVLDEGDALDEAMKNTIRTWVRPARPVAEFLEAYSLAGGTHHSAIVLGDRAEALCGLAGMLNIPAIRID
jgi:L-arabinose isomerase